MRLVWLIDGTLVLLVSLAHAAPHARIHGGVHRTLKRQGTVNIFVTMREETKEVLGSLPHEASYSSRGDMIVDLVEKLEDHAKTSQAEITQLAAHEASASLWSEMRSFWISNQVFFRDATFELVEKLAAMPSVASIDEETVTPFPVGYESGVNESSTLARSLAVSQTSIQWGVDKVQAPALWAAGITGEGVIVGSMDSGVRATHEALRGGFVQGFGWYDPETQAAEPYDITSHGTHTLGTIVGANGIGVAPGAKWVMCKGSRLNLGYTQADQLACAQFMVCPTNPSGTVRDCSKAPRVVSNSWNGGGGNNKFVEAGAAWAKAGIIPVFITGNSGPNCSTVGSPGDLTTVIGVGATDFDDNISSFSGRGPSVAGVTKPDIMAPGQNVVSASRDSDSGYVTKSGTSMAAPHVAGVIALLLSAEPTLTFEQVRQRLTSTADKASLKSVDQQCGGIASNQFPNNVYGWGRVNAFTAVKGPRKAGQCEGFGASCEAAFFCTWDALVQECQRWW